MRCRKLGWLVELIPVNPPTSPGTLACEVVKLGGKRKHTQNLLIHLVIGWRACKYLGTLRVLGTDWSLFGRSEYTQRQGRGAVWTAQVGNTVVKVWILRPRRVASKAAGLVSSILT